MKRYSKSGEKSNAYICIQLVDIVNWETYQRAFIVYKIVVCQNKVDVVCVKIYRRF